MCRTLWMNWFRFGRRSGFESGGSGKMKQFLHFSYLRPVFWYWVRASSSRIRTNYLPTIVETFVCDDRHEHHSKVCLFRNCNLINGTTLKYISHAILSPTKWSCEQVVETLELSTASRQKSFFIKLTKIEQQERVIYKIRIERKFPVSVCLFILMESLFSSEWVAI